MPVLIHNCHKRLLWKEGFHFTIFFSTVHSLIWLWWQCACILGKGLNKWYLWVFQVTVNPDSGELSSMFYTLIHGWPIYWCICTACTSLAVQKKYTLLLPQHKCTWYLSCLHFQWLGKYKCLSTQRKPIYYRELLIYNLFLLCEETLQVLSICSLQFSFGDKSHTTCRHTCNQMDVLSGRKRILMLKLMLKYVMGNMGTRCQV